LKILFSRPEFHEEAALEQDAGLQLEASLAADVLRKWEAKRKKRESGVNGRKATVARI